jgi:methionine-rich copper-binding protein CopC
MKPLRTLLSLSMVLSAPAAFAQASATQTATTTGRIITSIAIAKTADLNFGDIVSTALAGTVVVTPAGARSATGGSQLAGGTVTAASFNITGQASKTYAITLPAAAFNVTSGANTMAVNTFTSNPSGTGALSGAGAQTLTVGATLAVGATQATGTYTNAASLSVTVTYN